jgi:hypothetical protein
MRVASADFTEQLRENPRAVVGCRAADDPAAVLAADSKNTETSI